MVLPLGIHRGAPSVAIGKVAGVKSRPAFLESLSIGSFRNLLLSNGLSFMARHVQGMAVAWLVLEMTGSKLWVGIVNGVPALVIIFLSLLGGVLSDRIDRRTLLMWSRVSLAGLSFLSAVLVASGVVQLWQVMLMITLIMGVHAIDEPVGRTITLGVVGKDRLLSATSMTSLARNIGMVVGPSLVGVLIARQGVDAALYLLSGFYLVAFAALFLVPRGVTHGTVGSRLFEELSAGFAYIRMSPRLAWLVSLSASVPLAGVFFGMLPIYARDVLDVGSEGLGVMVAAYGMGGLVGSLYLMVRGRLNHQGLVAIGAGVAYGIGMLVVAFSPSFALTLVFTFTTGMSAATWLNTMSTVVQTSSEERMQGRVMSIFGLGVQLYSLGWLIGGVLATLFGNQGAMIISGVAFGGFHLLAYLKSAEIRAICQN